MICRRTGELVSQRQSLRLGKLATPLHRRNKLALDDLGTELHRRVTLHPPPLLSLRVRQSHADTVPYLRRYVTGLKSETVAAFKFPPPRAAYVRSKPAPVPDSPGIEKRAQASARGGVTMVLCEEEGLCIVHKF